MISIIQTFFIMFNEVLTSQGEKLYLQYSHQSYLLQIHSERQITNAMNITSCKRQNAIHYIHGHDFNFVNRRSWKLTVCSNSGMLHCQTKLCTIKCITKQQGFVQIPICTLQRHYSCYFTTYIGFILKNFNTNILS